MDIPLALSSSSESGAASALSFVSSSGNVSTASSGTLVRVSDATIPDGNITGISSDASSPATSPMRQISNADSSSSLMIPETFTHSQSANKSDPDSLTVHQCKIAVSSKLRSKRMDLIAADSNCNIRILLTAVAEKWMSLVDKNAFLLWWFDTHDSWKFTEQGCPDGLQINSNEMLDELSKCRKKFTSPNHTAPNNEGDTNPIYSQHSTSEFFNRKSPKKREGEWRYGGRVDNNGYLFNSSMVTDSSHKQLLKVDYECTSRSGELMKLTVRMPDSQRMRIDELAKTIAKKTGVLKDCIGLILSYVSTSKDPHWFSWTPDLRSCDMSNNSEMDDKKISARKSRNHINMVERILLGESMDDESEDLSCPMGYRPVSTSSSVSSLSTDAEITLNRTEQNNVDGPNNIENSEKSHLSSNISRTSEVILSSEAKRKSKHESLYPVISYQNEKPVWNSETRTYTLEFGGRASVPSVYNFQIKSKSNPAQIILQLGKVSDQEFNLDYSIPFDKFTAFAICVSVLSRTLVWD